MFSVFFCFVLYSMYVCMYIIHLLFNMVTFSLVYGLFKYTYFNIWFLNLNLFMYKYMYG